MIQALVVNTYTGGRMISLKGADIRIWRVRLSDGTLGYCGEDDT